MKYLRAFTVPELVGAIVIIGIMAALAIPAISGMLSSGKDQQAIGLAQAINQAQQTYKLRVAGAATNYSSAADSSARYLLIASYVPYSSATLSAYQPTGYTFALSTSLDTKVTITRTSDSTTVSY
jgi:type II secretory pathway pseudopilin PulG